MQDIVLRTYYYRTSSGTYYFRFLVDSSCNAKFIERERTRAAAPPMPPPRRPRMATAAGGKMIWPLFLAAAALAKTG